MQDKKKTEDAKNTATEAKETVKEESAENTVKEEPAPKAGPTDAEIIETLRAELKEKDDRYLRMAAEYDNFRRRSREERDAVYADAVADTAKELLPIIDNLERACAFEDGEKVKEGLVLTIKTVDAALEKLGIKTFGEVGDTFDPNLHNAVMHVEDENAGENVIVDVFQKGYQKGNKIIRFAMVKTAN